MKKFISLLAVLAAATAIFASVASATNYPVQIQLYGGSVASARVYCSTNPNGPWGMTYSDGYGRATCYGPYFSPAYARAEGHTDACHYYWWAQTNNAWFGDNSTLLELNLFNYTQEC